VYAIIEAGGHQVKVEPGASVVIDRQPGQLGEEIVFERVLFVEKDGGDIFAGTPFVPDARVIGVLQGETKGPKIRVFKRKRRKGMRRTKGHRTQLTRVDVKEILL